MKRSKSDSEPVQATTSGTSAISDKTTSANMTHEKSQKRVGKRPGRKPSKIDQNAKLERSRQSARECRARKKLRYQYLEELVASREKSVFYLRDELEMYKRWCCDLDLGIVPDGLLKAIAQEDMHQKPMALSQASPQSSSSGGITPSSASPMSVMEEDHSGRQQQQYSQLGHHNQPQQQAQFPGQQLVEQARSQCPVQQHQLPLQTTISTPEQQQTLTVMHRGSRSFEEASGCSALSVLASSSSLYRTGSVPNLAASSSTQSVQQQLGVSSTELNSTKLAYVRDYDSSSASLNSGGFSPRFSFQETGTPDKSPNTTSSAGFEVQNSSLCTSNNSWAWGSGRDQTTVPPNFLQSRVSSTNFNTPSCAAGSTDTGSHLRGSFSSAAPSSRVTSTLTSGSCVATDTDISYQQRPRSNSELPRRVSSTATSSVQQSSAGPLSHSHQNLSGIFSSSHDLLYNLSDAITTTTPCCTSLQQNSAPLPSQDTASMCSSLELSASISEPIPHWYSFLHDLEGATFSARRGALSDAGTPGSSVTRSGPGTPSSVGSPYSQAPQLQQQQKQKQQQHQQQQQQYDGNIPNIISDLLDNS